MASSCSFYTGPKDNLGSLRKDQICFAGARNTDNLTIVIEKEKFTITKEQIEEYLSDLQEFFDFDFEYKGGRFLVHYNEGKGSKRILFCMFVRFIWEGTYNSNSSNDQFYLILPIYFKYKKYYTKRNRMLLLLVCCNWMCYYDSQNDHFLNYNHFVADPRYFIKTNVKLIDSVANASSINGHFTKGASIKEYPKKVAELRTKKDFCDFYNFIIQNTTN